MRNRFISLALVLVLLLAAVFSATMVADWSAEPETHTELVASLDAKISTVMKLAATSTMASAGVSAMPGDTASGIAEKLADLSGIFLVILCVLYSEKFLVCFVGLAAFRYILPLALLLVAGSLIPRFGTLRAAGVKLVIFALVLFLAIPFSIRLSDSIYGIYEESVSDTLSTAEKLGSDLSGMSSEEAEDSTLWEKMGMSVRGVTDKAANTFNRLLESIAILLVTTCVIPLLGLVIVVWLIKLLFGVDLSPAFREGAQGAFRRGRPPRSEEEHHAEEDEFAYR